jgi:hypothetical protein
VGLLSERFGSGLVLPPSSLPSALPFTAALTAPAWCLPWLQEVSVSTSSSWLVATVEVDAVVTASYDLAGADKKGDDEEEEKGGKEGGAKSERAFMAPGLCACVTVHMRDPAHPNSSLVNLILTGPLMSAALLAPPLPPLTVAGPPPSALKSLNMPVPVYAWFLQARGRSSCPGGARGCLRAARCHAAAPRRSTCPGGSSPGGDG